jgi:hypothetical protein
VSSSSQQTSHAPKGTESSATIMFPEDCSRVRRLLQRGGHKSWPLGGPGQINCVRRRLIFVDPQGVTLLAPKILRRFLDFWKIHAPLVAAVS